MANKYISTGFIAVFCGIFLVACETTRSVDKSPAVGAPPGQSAFVKNYLALEKGMPSENVEALFGKPESIEALLVDNVESSVWRYSELLESKVRMTTQGMAEEQYWDIFENEMKTREVAIEGTERLEVRAELELLMFQGKLVSWKDEVTRKRLEY